MRRRPRFLALALLPALTPAAPAEAGMLLELVNSTVFDVQVQVINLTALTGIPAVETLPGGGTITKTVTWSSADVQVMVRLHDQVTCNGIVTVTASDAGARCETNITDKLGRTGVPAGIVCPVTIQQGGTNCTVRVGVSFE